MPAGGLRNALFEFKGAFKFKSARVRRGEGSVAVSLTRPGVHCGTPVRSQSST